MRIPAQNIPLLRSCRKKEKGCAHRVSPPRPTHDIQIATEFPVSDLMWGGHVFYIWLLCFKTTMCYPTEDRCSLSRANSAFWETFWSFFSAPPVLVCVPSSSRSTFSVLFPFTVPLTATTPTPQKCAPVNRPKYFDDRRSFWHARLNLNRCWSGSYLCPPVARPPFIRGNGPSTIENAFPAGRYTRIIYGVVVHRVTNATVGAIWAWLSE